VQDNAYYPFGMEIAELTGNYNYSVASSERNNYLYNGKEKQNDFNLDWLDYGFRFYDAAPGSHEGVKK